MSDLGTTTTTAKPAAPAPAGALPPAGSVGESWNSTQKLLAFIIVIAFIIIILIWMFHPPASDAASTPVLYTLVGTLGGFGGTVVTYFFGSTKGSQDKDATIQKLTS